jgi:hypothetical protein
MGSSITTDSLNYLRIAKGCGKQSLLFFNCVKSENEDQEKCPFFFQRYSCYGKRIRSLPIYISGNLCTNTTDSLSLLSYVA